MRPDNGQVTISTYNVGGVVTYTCNNGYTLTGANTRRCVQNRMIGQWTHQPPTCSRKSDIFTSDHNFIIMTTLSPSAVDCGSLNSITNGQVMVPATAFNNMAIYSCNSAYTLNGTQTRTCQASGMWSNADPTCDGEYKYSHAKKFIISTCIGSHPQFSVSSTPSHMG